MRLLGNEELKTYCPSGDIPNDIIVIDIREPDEHAREHIGGSINVPSSQLDSANLEQCKDKTILVYCRTGNRTNRVKEILSNIQCKEIFCIEGGIEQWKRCGFETKKNTKAPIELIRQVQITVGFLIILSIALTYYFSPYFIFISLFCGAGLLFAGITGTCGMAKLLTFLPYNKRLTTAME